MPAEHVGKKVSGRVWSAFHTGRAQVRIKNSSKHIVISHLATLISTAMHSHCSTELACFPEEFFSSLDVFFFFFILYFFLSWCPPTMHILAFFYCLSSANSLPLFASLLLIPFDLQPSLIFSIRLILRIPSSSASQLNASPPSPFLTSCDVYPTSSPSFLPTSLCTFPSL